MHQDFNGDGKKGFLEGPFFTINEDIFMNFRQKVEALLNDFLATREDLFLIDLKISAGNDIIVILDGDNSLSIQDCLDASRSIENNLNREEEDFSLQVMSAGVTDPLKIPRQYKKNIGRDLEITLEKGETIKGEIIASDDESVTLLLRYRKPKDIGKGKIDVEENCVVPFVEIKKAVIVIKF